MRSDGRAKHGTKGLGLDPGGVADGPGLGVPGAEPGGVIGATSRAANRALRVPLLATTSASAWPVIPVASRAVPGTALETLSIGPWPTHVLPSVRVDCIRVPAVVQTAYALPAPSSASQN